MGASAWIENGSEKQGFGDKRTGSLLMRRAAAGFEKPDGTGRPSNCENEKEKSEEKKEAEA